MLLGGVDVDDRVVRDLAAILDRSLGNKLESALVFRAKIVGLTTEERRRILAALEHAPARPPGRPPGPAHERGVAAPRPLLAARPEKALAAR